MRHHILDLNKMEIKSQVCKATIFSVILDRMHFSFNSFISSTPYYVFYDMDV